MGLFGKKKKEGDGPPSAEEEEQPQEEQKEDKVDTGNPKLDIQLTRINTKLAGAAELRKANSERFSRISEQIGELRGMIMDTNKAMGAIEVASTKAADLVESVQPQKLMVEMRKEDGKVEALKANLESNEALMKDLFAEMKKMRQQMNFYKGVEQVTKMYDEMKKQILESKKIEANISRHADKVDTIFLDVSKKFAEFDKFNDVVVDMQKQFQQMTGDFEKIKVKVEEKQSKTEFIDLVNKFNEFEKHTTNLIKLLDEKSKDIKYDVEAKFEQVKKQLEKKFDTKLEVKETQRPPPVPIKDKVKGMFKKEEKKEEPEEEAPDDGLGSGDDKPVDNLGAGDDKPAEQPKPEEKKEG